MYTEFYTELLNARGIKPTTDTDIEDQEYDDLSSDEKDLYDKITEMLGEKWTHEETIEFMDELMTWYQLLPVSLRMLMSTPVIAIVC
jgi:hypothetical protein